jgi:hypothetical protein
MAKILTSLRGIGSRSLRFVTAIRPLTHQITSYKVGHNQKRPNIFTPVGSS